MTYAAFLDGKRRVFIGSGFEVKGAAIHEAAFPFQRDLTRWALRKGRAAIFADTGMGKTLMQLEWARLTGKPTLILAPLAVTRQTVAEGRRWGIAVTYARSQAQAATDGITITNYEMLPHFEVSAFSAVALDESSILKAFDGKTRTRLIETFANTPFRLCCTATPAPNDIAELANHAEFLGIMSRAEMLATFFVHDDNGWRLKRHGRDAFYRWLASWGMSIRKPSDLGYEDDGYELPALTIVPLIVQSDWRPDGQLFATGLQGITGRSEARRATLSQRVDATARLVRESQRQPWLIWCGLNDEGRELARLLPDATLIEGSDSPEAKADALDRFAHGEIPILITKPTIAGFGMNFQNCADMAFLGLSDSYEQYYQAIRRCWRYGQARPVQAWVVLSEPEAPIYENVRRKEDEARMMQTQLVENVREFERAEIGIDPVGQFEYAEATETGASWQLMLGDSVERMVEIPDESVGLSVHSPPFQSLYTYTASERDLGNSGTRDEFFEHYGYIITGLLRVTQPGRNACVHVQQLATHLASDGVIGMRDFRGDVIRAYVAAGWIYHAEVCIDKNPQSQAIRTHSKGLLFKQLRKDSSWLHQAFADYVIVFRKPGDNAIPIKPNLTNDEWIEWARPIWYGIRESDTLNIAEARGKDDERHICPLQLGTIERCIRLWSNPGEMILDPFAGIGSTVREAVRLGRYGIGIELKPEYWRVAVKNTTSAERIKQDGNLFSFAGIL